MYWHRHYPISNKQFFAAALSMILLGAILCIAVNIGPRTTTLDLNKAAIVSNIELAESNYVFTILYPANKAEFSFIAPESFAQKGGMIYFKDGKWFSATKEMRKSLEK